MISRRDIIKYLRYAITQELNIIYTTLIEKVVIFDKKVEIYFKYCDAGSDPEKNNFPPLKHSSAIIPSSPPPITQSEHHVQIGLFFCFLLLVYSPL